jgi:hypothetical protein
MGDWLVGTGPRAGHSLSVTAHARSAYGQICLLKRGKSNSMIRKLRSGQYRLYSRKKNPRTGKRRNLGTFKTRAAAEKHERAVQYFKRRG